VLWERDGELRCLRDAFRACRNGHGTTILVAGEAGIGKTSLLRHFASGVGDDAAVLFGTCDDLHTPRTLGPFRDMFDGGGFGDGPADREHYIGLLRAALADAERPAIIIVDDAHWADAGSLDVIRYLARRLASLPGLLLVSYRPDDLAEEHPLRRVLGAMATVSTVRLDLRPLSDETVGRLATEAGHDPEALIAAVGGNPFHLTEVLATGGTGVPPTVRDAVMARVLGLPEPSRRALELLSVIPTEAERALVESILGRSVSRALDHAERAGVISSSSGYIRFRHELARRAVESSLPGSARTDLNRRVLHRLVEVGAPASRLVHHAAIAGTGAVLARYACVAAEEAAAARAHGETATSCRLALDREDLLDERTAARLHGLAARACYALSRFGEAARHAERAVGAWERMVDGPFDLGMVLLVSSRMHTMNGLPDHARAQIERAIALLTPFGPSRTLAYAYGMKGALETIEANCAEAVRWCRRSLAIADDLALADVTAHARIYLGLARIGLGDLEGLGDLHAAIDLARRGDHGDLLCRATTNLATAMIWLGRHNEATAYLDLAEAAGREYGLDYILFHVLAGRSQVDIYRGRWDEAERRLRQQLKTDRDPAAMMTLPLALLGRILARRGDPAAADLIARAWELATRSRQAHRLAVAGTAVIEHAWLAGDTATVQAIGDVLAPIARRANLVFHLGEVHRYLARVGVRVPIFDGCPAGFAAGIAGDIDAAVAAWNDAGNPYEQALEEIGSTDRETAVRGIQRLDRLGAVVAANRCRRELLRRGISRVPRGPRAATRSHPAGLTARQQDVLALLTKGLTTAKIAEQLYLSPRTVDNHVAEIMTRLGVTNRRDAVAAATRAGWVPAVRAG
jgi:DNA-binding CsgD family transcriptional regulator/tetratricopeptide (TPR) repeat protein